MTPPPWVVDGVTRYMPHGGVCKCLTDWNGDDWPHPGTTDMRWWWDEALENLTIQHGDDRIEIAGAGQHRPRSFVYIHDIPGVQEWLDEIHGRPE